MQKIFSEINILNNNSLEELNSQLPFYLFDENVIDYLNSLSKELFRLEDLKNYPDLLTFAFYCRKSNLLNLKKLYVVNSAIKIGRGLAFHITPSNVPTNFAYSFISGLLSGNINVVRVPSKEFKQVELFFKALNRLDEATDYKAVKNRSLFLKYDRSSSVTEYLSSICDVRLIWGGNSTIEQIRKNKIPARSIDITFSDRYSFSIINATKYLEFENKIHLAEGFYNDTYLFDQNACTSPQLVFWFGDDVSIKNAKDVFWSVLHNYVIKKYQISAITGVDKLTQYLSFKTYGVDSTVLKSDNYLWRIQLKSLPQDIDKFKGDSGYFFEYDITCLDQIKPIINNKFQSLAYFGFDKCQLNDFILQNNFKGIDRIVPIGKTAEFSLTWDGYNLIEHLTRTVQIL